MKGLIHHQKHILVLAMLISLGMGSCSVKKFIPEGKYLSTDADVVLESDTTIEGEARLKYELHDVLRPRPNDKVFGGYLGLYFYYKNQQERPGFFNKFMFKKFGEKPVYQEEVKTRDVELLLRNRLENRGFFYNQVSSNFEVNEKRRTSKVTYTIALQKPYEIATFQLDTLPSSIRGALKETLTNTLITTGQRFDLSLMKLERERIDSELKKRGFYNFNSGFLIFEADTNRYKSRKFDLFLGLKKDVPQKSLIPYKISEINVFPVAGLDGDTMEQETITLNDINFIGGESFFKAIYLEPFITLQKGQLYDAQTSKNTSRRLSTIGVYKFVNIQFEELNGADFKMGSLRANIYLSPLNKRAVRAEMQVVSKSNNFAGPALAVIYSNRNLFKGGETFNLSTNVGYELQVGNENQLGSNTSVGVKGEMTIPRVLFPLKINTDFFIHDIPKTKTSLSIDYSNRSRLYKLLSASAEFGYVWNAATYVEHTLALISINYTNLYKSTPAFDVILDENPFLAQSFQQQFIAGLTYSFTFNELINSKKKHVFFFNSNFDLAGNALNGLTPSASIAGESESFLGLDYAQFAKLDIDLRYHLRLTSDQTIVSRVFAGYGLPYGNSVVMPFTKQYYSGGPYGVRAFRIRSLGPGTYDSDVSNSTSFFEQTGNIRLEGNLEYRFPIFSYLKGAVFTDAGNIWNSNAIADLPGGQFTSSFINEFGMGVGVGLRIDVQGFVIRFDFATPYHTPSLPAGEMLGIRIKDTKFNFAIGYPF